MFHFHFSSFIWIVYLSLPSIETTQNISKILQHFRIENRPYAIKFADENAYERCFICFYTIRVSLSLSLCLFFSVKFCYCCCCCCSHCWLSRFYVPPNCMYTCIFNFKCLCTPCTVSIVYCIVAVCLWDYTLLSLKKNHIDIGAAARANYGHTHNK